MTGEAGAPGIPQTTLLDNGVQIVTESIRGVRSAAVGVWVRQGAAHEPRAALGSSHMLEHMAFKGTRRRTSREIALSLESLGGSLDAYTSREHTSYQARVLDENLPEAVDILADLVLDPLLEEKDLEREKEVVLEEISTVEDTPDDLVFELHGDRMWGDTPTATPSWDLGNPCRPWSGATWSTSTRGATRGRSSWLRRPATSTMRRSWTWSGPDSVVSTPERSVSP